jgi:hypothetical protein
MRLGDKMLVQDKNTLDRFVNLLPDLKEDEVFFLSCSARNKYLDEAERLEYKLQRTEMFSREVARDKEGIYKALQRMEVSLQYRKTGNGKDIPEKCIVVYMNINPSSMIKSYLDFQNRINKEMEQIVMSFKNGNQPNYERMLRLPQQLNNSIQVSQSRKYFIDIDVDLYDNKYKSQLVNIIREFVGDNAFVEKLNFIDTKSGIHLLIKKEDIPLKYNLMSLVERIRAFNPVKEAEFNKNNMIPMPGTHQANHTVRFM